MITFFSLLLSQVSIPTELEPVSLAGSILSTHKATIVALIGFAIALGFIGTVVVMIRRSLGFGGRSRTRASKYFSIGGKRYHEDDIPF